MLHCPILKENFSAYTLYGEGHLLLSDVESFALEGHLLPYLIPLLNGAFTREAIAQQLAQVATEAEVFAALDYLAQAGHLREADINVPREEAVFWSSIGVDSQHARAQLALFPVAIYCLGEIGIEEASGWAQALGVNVNPAQHKIKLVFADDYLQEELAAINAEAQANGTPWLLVRPNGIMPLIGPLFIPGTTGCWECLKNRLAENRDVEVMLAERLAIKGVPARPIIRASAFSTQALAAAAVQLTRYIVSGVNPEITGCLNQMNPLTLERKKHLLIRRPQCVCCGDDSLGIIGGAPTEFEERISARGVENGERIERAKETFDKYSAHISPLTGVVKDLVASAYNDISPLKSFSAGNNLAVKPSGLVGLKQNMRSVSSGKGSTIEQAKTSALCEALERYSGKFRGEEARVPATLEILGDAAIHPNDVMLYSKQQYADRDAWNAKGSQFQIVPEYLGKDEETDWTPVWSTTQKRMKYLPTSLLFYSYPAKNGRFTSWADSNGAAAGSCFEDAYLQGLMELVERDSVALWWYNRTKAAEVDLAELDDPFLKDTFAFYKGLGREFHVLDITSDIGIPSFVAINRRVGGPTEDIVMGFGAHLDAATGIMRAITEMNQFMPAVLNVGVDGQTRYAFDDPDSLHWWQTATYENQPYLVPSDERRQVSDFEAVETGNITTLLREAIARVEAVGVEVLVLDETRIDIGLPVVRVFAPGLRHFWARFAPGRLYDGPVKIGLLDKPLKEAQLNPIAMFL